MKKESKRYYPCNTCALAEGCHSTEGTAGDCPGLIEETTVSGKGWITTIKINLKTYSMLLPNEMEAINKICTTIKREGDPL